MESSRRSFTNRRWGRSRTRLVATLTSLATGSLLLLATPPAGAEVGVQGSARILVGEGPSGEAMRAKKVRVGAAGAASARPARGGSTEITLPVRTVRTAERSVVSLAGSIRFARKGNTVFFRRLILVSSPDETFIRATVGGSTFRAFLLGPAARVDQRVGTVDLSGRAFRLGKRAAILLSNRLGLGGLAAARVGRTTLSSQAAFDDPFAATCQLPATTKVPGDVPAAPEPAQIEGGIPGSSGPISWGIRSGLRSYLFFLPEGQGVIQGIDGGVVVPALAPPPAPPVPSGFTFPFDRGSWLAGGDGQGDVRALIEGSGSILLCHKTQFRILLSNPSIVVDGFDAGLLFDVDTNVLGEWIPTQRVRLADLVTSEATYEQTASSVSWANVPVILTEAGSKTLRLAPFSPTFRYQAGQALQPISFSLDSEAG